VTACDIGDAGPAEGAPVSFHWSLWWSLGSRLGWFILLPLMLLKENRRRAAWWIAVPVALETALLSYAGRWLAMLDMMMPLPGIVMALAACWLLGDRLPRRSAWRRAGAALAIWGTACGLAWAAAAESFSGFLVLLELLPALLAGLVFAGACALSLRRGPGIRPFAVRMLPWLAALMAAMALLLALVFMGASWEAGMSEYLLPIAGAAVLWGAAAGFVIWLLLLPFLLLGARSSLYAARLKAMLSPEEKPGEAP